MFMWVNKANSTNFSVKQITLNNFINMLLVEDMKCIINMNTVLKAVRLIDAEIKRLKMRIRLSSQTIYWNNYFLIYIDVRFRNISY